MKKKRSHAFKVSRRRNSPFLYFVLILLTLACAFFGYEYFILKKENYFLKKSLIQKNKTIKSLENIVLKEKKRVKKLLEIKKKELEKSSEASEAEDYLYSLNFSLIKLPPLSRKEEKKGSFFKSAKKKVPKLVIILDDIAFKREVDKIKSLPIKVTPSFFPPSKRHPKTPLYAGEFKTYMVHLPLEAYKFARVEKNTLDVNDSLEKIEKRIKNIRAKFPNAKFINNHTGSKFTSDKKAMERLLKVLKKYGFSFIDSKTSPHSQAEAAAYELNMSILSRDVFLDNVGDANYIKNQLREAVKIAKRRGYAVAIGHPRKATFKALKECKGILKGVEVVYIDEL